MSVKLRQNRSVSVGDRFIMTVAMVPRLLHGVMVLPVLRRFRDFYDGVLRIGSQVCDSCGDSIVFGSTVQPGNDNGLTCLMCLPVD